LGAGTSIASTAIAASGELHSDRSYIKPVDERPWWSSVSLLLFLGLAAFVGWAAYFEIDQSVRANGQIIPTARNQVVQVADGGVLA
jgi:multidrug efflux pump subunit AcrA (membrane-fusion protein)